MNTFMQKLPITDAAGSIDATATAGFVLVTFLSIVALKHIPYVKKFV